MTSVKNTPLDKNAKIYIAGHKGLVGSAILRFYQSQGFKNIITKKDTYIRKLSKSDKFTLRRKEY